MLIAEITEGAKRLGGVVALGNAIGVGYRSFYAWSKIPPQHVLNFERATGISRHKLRPDLYPLERRAKRKNGGRQ